MLLQGYNGLFAVALAMVAAAQTPVAPPAGVSADPFYAKHLDASGIPVLSSAKVPDGALAVAQSIIVEMLAHRPDLARSLVGLGVRVAVMAEDETTTDLPEQRDWKKPARDDPRLTRCERRHYDERIGALSDRDYWARRARGMGGVFTSAAAEDLLGLTTSRYHGETTFIHEFAHTILRAIRVGDPTLSQAIDDAYATARREGRWRDEYAMTTVDEYWAVGTQLWFNSKRLIVVDGRRILSHGDLAAYDPALYRALGQVYGERHHLTADPSFEHPARIPPGPPPASTAEVC